MGEARLKYLDMLQGVIARMAGNQFTCRTWSITLGTAIIGYAAAKDSKPHSALLALLPAVCFWIQDAYYLALERRFRELFQGAAKNTTSDPTFCFDSSFSFSDFLNAARSVAVLAVHPPVIALALLVGEAVWPK